MEFSENTINWGGLRWYKQTCTRLDNDICLEQYGYKVYSQNDEDGIIQEVFHRIGTTNKTFIEFGVENGLECNSHFLLYHNWKGLWIEGSDDKFQEIQIKFRPLISKEILKVENAFITCDNINDLIRKNDIIGEIDLLSIDMDGNDYYIWECIDVINPRVVIIEYNGKFPPDLVWKMAYNEKHIWDTSDWHGASLKALELLGKRLGYQLVGTNINGANAFFVRTDLTLDRFYTPSIAEHLYNPLRLQLLHRNGHPARYCLADQEVGLGIFNYVRNININPLYGFHHEEVWDNDRRIRWISSKRSGISIYNEDSQFQNYIKFHYYNGIPEVLYNDLLILDITINNRSINSISIIEQEGDIIIEIPKEHKNDEIYNIDIQISYLWKPSELLKSDDERNLGVAIDFKSFLIK